MKLALILAYIVTVTSALVLVDSTLASACVYYDLKFDWGCGSHGNGMKAYACRCGNINWLGTVTNCIRSNSDSVKLVEHAYRHIARRCLDKGNFVYSLDDMWHFYENGTQYLRDPTSEDESSPVFTALRVNQTDFDWYYQKFKDFTRSAEVSQWFGWGLVFYWVTIVALATLHNLTNKYFGRQLYPKSFKRFLTIPPFIPSNTATYKRINTIFPDASRTRLQVLVVTVFVVLTMISVGVGYRIQTPHPYLTSRWFMNLDIVSYRVDLMAMSLFPIIYFFGIRNNPFIPLTGLGYPTFHYFHKWCAYVCAILAFIHSIIWTAYSIQEGGYKSWWVDSYWQWGIAAMTILGLLVFHGAKLIRDFAYEVFLFFHKLFNVFFIIAMYYHCVDMGWLGWIWSMVAIICFERVMRIARILLNGGLQTASLTYCGESVIKMRFKQPRLLQYFSGSYSFIYFVDPNDPWYFPWQSHPFTLLTTPELDDGYLVAYFRAHKGVTKHLLEKLVSSGKNTIPVKVLIEGPYGDSPQLSETKQKLVGVAAGLGITAVYSYFLEISKNGKSPLKKKIVWIAGKKSHLDWFSNELEWLASNDCEILIYFSNGDSEENSICSCKNSKTLEKIEIQHLTERLNLDLLVSDEISSASSENLDLAIISCGPESFSHELRSYISQKTTDKLGVDIDYREESFTW